MIQTVVKRDGAQVSYDAGRICEAIRKAGQAINEPVGEYVFDIVHSVEDELGGTASVDQIQDKIEEKLMALAPNVARSYIVYRKERDVHRARYSKLVKTFDEIIEVEDNDMKNENANIDGNTPAGQMMKFASESTKPYAMDYLLNPLHAKAHQEGLIHIHDLDYMPTKTTTCVQYDLNKLFKNGFNSGHGYLREPQHIRSAGALAAIAFQANQNQQHGGQAIPAFDHFMAPSVAKTFKKNFMKYWSVLEFQGYTAEDVEGYMECEIKLANEELISESYPQVFRLALNETIQDVDQAMEAFLANMNSMHSRGGGQIVFSSINYGTDISPEGRMVTYSILKACENGLGRGETAIFPIHIFKVKNGLSYSDEDFDIAIKNMDDALAGNLIFKTPNFDLFVRACEVSSKRLFPNFVFLDAPFNQHPKWKLNDPERFKYEIATMGCRTRVFEDIHGETTSWGRGNLSFTTINLVKLAIETRLEAEQMHTDPDLIAEHCKALFLDKLSQACNLVADQLYARYQFQCTAKAKQFPFLMGQGLWTGGDELAPGDRVEDVLKHGSLCIGYIGLAEALKMMLGKHHGESQEAQQLGLGSIALIHTKCQFFKKEYGLNFACLATPAEGLAGRFTSIDRKRYGSIPGVTDREYYTNSNHVPVYFPITAYEKIKLESPYHRLTPGGHILYVEMDAEAKKNVGAFMQLIRNMYESGAGYGSVNHPVDRCTACGHEGTIDDACPKCGESIRIDRIRRITGYLVGTTDRWNSFKQAEERDRVKHGL